MDTYNSNLQYIRKHLPGFTVCVSDDSYLKITCERCLTRVYNSYLTHTGCTYLTELIATGTPFISHAHTECDQFFITWTLYRVGITTRITPQFIMVSKRSSRTYVRICHAEFTDLSTEGIVKTAKKVLYAAKKR
jgi:hypothetical protein